LSRGWEEDFKYLSATVAAVLPVSSLKIESQAVQYGLLWQTGGLPGFVARPHDALASGRRT
jgi:hypothetical protein